VAALFTHDDPCSPSLLLVDVYCPFVFYCNVLAGMSIEKIMSADCC